MSNNLSRNVYYNCYSDLQRSAKHLFLTPKSSVSITFLDHAFAILEKDKDAKVQKYCKTLKDIRNNIIDIPEQDVARTADKILTIGILLKHMDTK